jgi:hypothetical protein
LAFDTVRLRAGFTVNESTDLVDERGATVGGANADGCLAVAISLNGEVEWTRHIEISSGGVDGVEVEIDALGRTWIACSVFTGSFVVDPDGLALTHVGSGSFLARLSESGDVEHLEVNNATAIAIVTWPDGRTAIAKGGGGAATTLEWFATDGGVSASLDLAGTGPARWPFFEMLRVDETSDDVLLSISGGSFPQSFPFESGVASSMLRSGSTVMRVRPTGVVWASAFDGESSFPVLWVASQGGRAVLVGGAASETLVDVIDGTARLESNSVARMGFIADLDLDGHLTNVVRVPPESVVTQPAVDGLATFAGVQLGGFGETRFAVGALNNGLFVQSPDLALQGESLIALSTRGSAAALITSFGIGDPVSSGEPVDIEPLVPDSLISPTNGVVVMRPTMSWLP